jgi:hypothetical protein
MVFIQNIVVRTNPGCLRDSKANHSVAVARGWRAHNISSGGARRGQEVGVGSAAETLAQLEAGIARRHVSSTAQG